ncbi:MULTISPECIES: HdeD family acid-resistance protein [Halocynthiibacter]|uniref:DUF308 domain-containing protein n=1 Tax=Halocynthiibacter halioticoli TaxID=2986804 RepID=A0AAE3IYB8_9RHOB|nr:MULTISPECIES: DUF308 domain-containing protein [Halocynthiibacter]MCV6823176.1 DUF308 domain-containing protein [Halocynthiibacter halioticoli]MCW4056177.1 DUF308 domain-containing protein [Halocynthiibacter sp. SDUM655004]MDE0590857.1 DUF308 domain-containing protein [Halocynthiibacter sp. C4]
MKSSMSWIILGAFMVLGGVFALLNPFAASLAVTALVGWFFLIGGAFALFAGFKGEGSGTSKVLNILLAVFFILAGISLLANPFKGLITLTVLLGILFMVTGVMRLYLSWLLRGEKLFWVMLITGAASVIIGFMVLNQPLEAASSLLGILLAIELLSDGIGSIAYGIILRKANKA